MPAPNHRFPALLPVLTAVAAYVVLSGLMLAANTTVLRLGDPKFGQEGWRLYWPIWGIAFAPVLLVGLVAALIYRRHPHRSAVFLAVVVAVTLVAMQISFLVDLKWQGVLTELVLLCLATTIAARRFIRQ